MNYLDTDIYNPDFNFINLLKYLFSMEQSFYTPILHTITVIIL